MKYLHLLLFFSLCIGQAYSQSYTLKQLEEHFIQENFELLTQRFEIQKSEAAILQEKLWENPTISLSEVNLWSNSTAEVMPPLWGGYGRKQQFALELEQLIETAGKRRKRVGLRELEKQSATLAFEQLLAQLRSELRQNFYKVQLQDAKLQQLQAVIELFRQLKVQYERQSDKHNVAIADYYRMQSELVSLDKEQLDEEAEMDLALQNIRVLTQLPHLQAKHLSFPKRRADLLSRVPPDLYMWTKQSNGDWLRLVNQEQLAQQQLVLERTQRKPDLTAQVLYDRGSSTMRNFVGLGLQIELPLFNKNNGPVKIAQHQLEQEKVKKTALAAHLELELSRLYKQLQKYEQALSNWQELESNEQQQLLQSYGKHLHSKRLTLLEFIDYTEAFREAYQAQQELWEAYLATYEELQHLAGRDFDGR